MEPTNYKWFSYSKLVSLGLKPKTTTGENLGIGALATVSEDFRSEWEMDVDKPT